MDTIFADLPRPLTRWTLPVTGENGWNRADLALTLDALAAYDRTLWARLNQAWQAWVHDDTHVLLSSDEYRRMRDALVMAANAWTGDDRQHAAELIGTLL